MQQEKSQYLSSRTGASLQQACNTQQYNELQATGCAGLQHALEQQQCL
jgi:hypothetical protein